MSFSTAEPASKDVLDDIAKGNAQLLDFQRGWDSDDTGKAIPGRDSEETTKVFGGVLGV
ncbi:hypothetical protein [Paraburkholderia sp. J63]|uniref:hypothetical protein n=1 Tax=Paraburkholderia sp. J63 TaxID=2805434 RepID=UPI002ABD591A|nr:hypothetical protein [Paraburkholderia sp. J63]